MLTTFIFDPENRLSQQQSAAGNSTYTYQGYNGLRRSANEPAASVTTFVWDGTDYLQERD